MTNIKDKGISFIGGGQMAEAIFSGLLDAGAVSPTDLCILDVAPERLSSVTQRYGVRVMGNDPSNNYSAIDAAKISDIIFVAVKPQHALSVIQSIAPFLQPDQLVISIVGGLPLAQLELYFQTPVVRVMPNTSMQVREGVAGIALGSQCTDYHADLVLELFGHLGKAFILPDQLIDPLTGISGCGPAYAYIFIEALADGGVKTGLPRDLAYKLAAQTLIGSAKMILQTGEHPGKLKDNVCSPGGATIAGVQVLEEARFRAAVIDAVEAGTLRMQEIGNKS